MPPRRPGRDAVTRRLGYFLQGHSDSAVLQMIGSILDPINRAKTMMISFRAAVGGRIMTVE